MVALNNGEAAIVGDSVRAVLWLFFGKNVTEHGPWQVSDLYSQWVLILHHQICLGDICFTVQSLQAVGVDFPPPNLFYFAEWHLLWHPISTGSECWSCATKYVQFCWATSALASDLYSEWVMILCHQICSILLSDIYFGVWYTVCEYWFCTTKSVLFCWVASALVSDIYSQWVLILCYQICFILLSDIWFAVWSLQAVSVDFVLPNLFDFSEKCLFLCLISTGSGCWFCATKSVWFSEQHLLWCPISTDGECWFCATKSVWFFWVTSAFVSDLYSLWVLILYHWLCLIVLHNVCFCLISIGSECWFCSTISVWFCWATSALAFDLYREWVLPPNLFDFAEWHLLWCPISTGSECWFCWEMSALVSDLYRQ